MRADLHVVADLVAPGSRVLDLGCGDGMLLAHLAAERGCTGTGVDNDPDSAVAAIGRGVSVIELDIDTQLDEFAADSYDVVVVSQTLQAAQDPRVILEQVRRIAGRGLVSVPNFGLWRHRVDLVLRGRMPVSGALPHPWYETPNIHLATLADLDVLFAEHRFAVGRRVALDSDGRELSGPASWGPANLTASGAVYLIDDLDTATGR